MSARTGSSVVAVLRPAALAARGVSDDAITGADAGASDAPMDFEFGLIELTPIELKTESGVSLAVQHDSNQSFHPRPGVQALLSPQPEHPSLGASTSPGTEPFR
jgi:hypothetical protein